MSNFDGHYNDKKIIEDIYKDSFPFKAKDGNFYPTMEVVNRVNDELLESTLVIDKNSELLDTELSPEELQKILDIHTYRALADVLSGILMREKSEADGFGSR